MFLRILLVPTAFHSKLKQKLFRIESCGKTFYFWRKISHNNLIYRSTVRIKMRCECVSLTVIVINTTLVISLTVPNFKRLIDVACGKRKDTSCMVFTGKMQTPQISAVFAFSFRFAYAFDDRCAPNKYPVSKDYKTGQNRSSIRHITDRVFPHNSPNRQVEVANLRRPPPTWSIYGPYFTLHSWSCHAVFLRYRSTVAWELPWVISSSFGRETSMFIRDSHTVLHHWPTTVHWSNAICQNIPYMGMRHSGHQLLMSGRKKESENGKTPTNQPIAKIGQIFTFISWEMRRDFLTTSWYLRSTDS